MTTSTAMRADSGPNRLVQPRELALGLFPVRDIVLGAKDGWRDGVLQVDLERLASRLVHEAGARRVAIRVARPGDSARIINILDAVEPRCKPDGGQSFPGFLGSLDGTIGRGETHALQGAAVIVCGQVPGEVASQVVSEAMVDMSGPGARYSPFSKTINLVITCDFYDDQGPLKRVAVARYAGLLAARLLAEATIGQRPTRTKVFPTEPRTIACRHDAPRVAYICPGMILSQLHQTFLAGTPIGTTPSIIAGTQMFDGILVSGNYDIGATRNPTFMYQRCPVLEELFEFQHAGDLVFAGVVVTQCLIDGYGGKQRSAHMAAQAAKLLDVDGVVISIEECGHAFADLMLTCQACEDLGIHTSLMMAESAGATGERAATLAFSPGADAVTSMGNMDEVVSLPAVDTLLGGTWPCGRWLLDHIASDPMDTPLMNIFAATCQMGAGTLRGEES